MQKKPVDGIGGFFFRASDPAALASWYANVFGITPVAKDYDGPIWTQAAGTTVFAPFRHSTAKFGPDTSKLWMLNLRTSDLDQLISRLRSFGEVVTVDQQAYPNGRFATLYDPEGNPLEIWEPSGRYKL